MNLTDPTPTTWNCVGAINEGKPQKVAPTRKQFGKVEFDAPESLPVNACTTKGNYAGLELRPFSSRAGAMDAFALKSMVGGKLVERRVGCGL